MKFIQAVFVSLLAVFSIQSSAIPLSQASMQAIVNQIVVPIKEQKDTPGIAVAVHYQGQDYIYTYGYANREQQIPVTADTIFDLASITKVFTTTLLAVDIGTGKVKLTDPITRFLPQLANTVNLPINNVKLVDLATHTSSFPRDFIGFGVNKFNQPGFYQALRSWQPMAPVGSQYLYSNVGMGLLGNGLGYISGKSYYMAVNQSILQPLSMTNTYIFVPQAKRQLQAQGYNVSGQPAPIFTPGFLFGGGALRSSAKDMLAFLKANLGETTNLTPSLQTSINSTHQPYYTVKPNFNMGLGWQRMMALNQLTIIKNGMNIGFNTFIGFSPQNKIGVVILANKRDAMATRLGNQLLKQLILQNNLS